MSKKPITDPVYVKRVTSNLKSPSGSRYTCELGPKTLLLGSNTSHKSSILQSVELALTGAADDVVGRSGVRDAGLLLSLVSGSALTASALISNGTEATYHLESARPDHDNAQVDAIVLRQVRAALAGSAATARKSFLGWSAGSVNRDDVVANIPAHLHAKYNDIADKQAGSEVDCLISVLDYANKRQRDAAKEAKGAQAVLDAGTGTDLGARPTDSDIELSKNALAEAQGLLETAIRAEAGRKARLEQSQRPDRSDIEAQAAEAQDSVHSWSNRVHLLQDEVHDAQPDATLKQAHSILTWAIANNSENCPVCSSHVGFAHINTCQVAYASAMTGPADELLGNLDEAEKALTGWKSKLQTLRAQLGAVTNIGPTPTDEAVVTSATITVGAAQSRLAAATAALTATETARAQWDSLARSRDVVAAMKADVEVYKELKKTCEQAVGALLDSRATSFAARVQAYLPSDWHFGIELRDGKKDVFRMGLRDAATGSLHCALSGAEWAAVTTAIAAAIHELSSRRELSVLIPEDRAWDGKTLAKVMRALSAFPGQVLMASTVKPKGKVPQGWLIIDMDTWTNCQSGVVYMDDGDAAGPSADADLPFVDTSDEVTDGTDRILKGLGFNIQQIGRMSRATAAEIINNGLFASHVSISGDGSYQPVDDNIIPMPTN